jgi:hypothetical protein
MANNVMFADVFYLSVKEMVYQTGAINIYKFKVFDVFGYLF